MLQRVVIMSICFAVLFVIFCSVYFSLESQCHTPEKHKLYIMFHDEQSERAARLLLSVPGTLPRKVGPSLFLESQVYTWLRANEQDWQNQDYIGILPYSICHKQNITKDTDVAKLIRNHFQKAGDADVVSFYRRFKASMWKLTRVCHPKLEGAWVALMSRMGVPYEAALSESIPFYPCSSWAAKPETMKKFIQFAERAMSIMGTDTKVRTLCFENSTYWTPSCLHHEQLVRIFGVPYYPLFPFIMERLPCFYFWYTGTRVWTGNLHLGLTTCGFMTSREDRWSAK